MRALILVDIQNDFMPGGALPVPDGDAIVDQVNQLQSKFDLIVATQDWHPANHGSFASQHPGQEAGTMIELDGLAQVLWPDHCIQGSTGAAFHPDLRTDADLILRKGYNPDIDSYSAFFENDHKTSTGLEGYLRTRGIENLTLVGLATDYCVAYSAIDAATLGFGVTVRADLCRAIDLDGSLAASLAKMKAAGVRLA